MNTSPTRGGPQTIALKGSKQYRRMSLESVKKGREQKPFCALLYGTEGVGKSSWAAEAPSPIFIQAEDGLGHLDVSKFELCTSWPDILDCTDILLEGGHDFKTVVLDTTDAAERMAWDHLLATRKMDSGGFAESIEDYGYGKGYTAAIDMWRPLLVKLQKLRVSGMNVILLSHAHIKSFSNPEGANFDRYQLKMNDKLAGLLKEWSECVLFATYEVYAAPLKGEKKAKGVGAGARIIRTERRPAFDAKNRYGLPFEMPLGFSDFYAYVDGSGAKQNFNECALLATEILSAAAGTKFDARVAAGVAEASQDLSQLRTIQNWLTAKLNGVTDK